MTAGHDHGHHDPVVRPGHGIARLRVLPDDDGGDAWRHLFLPDGLLDRLRNHAIFALLHRRALDRTRTAMHGLVVLNGPPGTGKTTAAQALAHVVADALAEHGRTTFVEIDPHALPSDLLGESQRNVAGLLERVLPEAADRQRFTIVLVDEVEAFAANRHAVSMTANPVDVHRATDAVLSGLDRLARDHPRLLLLATTNFVAGVDDAFLSRADLVVQFPLPDRAAVGQIVADTLEGLAREWPVLAGFANNHALHAELATRCAGLDGRQVRKAVMAAFTMRPELAQDPTTLTEQDLLDATSAFAATSTASLLQ